MHLLEELNEIVSRWLWWLRLLRSAQWMLHGLMGGLALALALGLILIPRLVFLGNEYAWLALAISLAGMALGGAAGLLWPQPRLERARYLDRRLHLHERVSAALELAGETPESESLRGVLIARQRQDALAAARRVELRRSLPIRLNRLEILTSLLVFGAVILVSLGWGEPYFQAAQERRWLKTAIEAEREQVEELRSQLEQLEGLTPDQRAELLSPLDQAILSLQSAESLEQAISALTTAEQELRLLAIQDALDQLEALQQAGQNLAAQAGSPLQETAQRLAEGDLQGAAETLAGLDPSTLNAEEAAQAAQALEELAQALENTNPDLAQSLNQAAQALRAGDPLAAQQALQDAAQSMQNTADQAALAQAAQSAAGQLSNQVGSLLNNPQLAQGPGQQAGQDGLGSGAGRGEGSGQDTQGPETGQTPIDPSNGPGDSGERAYQELYIPQRLGGEDGENVALPGSGDPGDQVLGERDVPLEQTGETRTPYIDALPAYREALRRAMDSGQVPIHLRPLIRDYFSSLEP